MCGGDAKEVKSLTRECCVVPSGGDSGEGEDAPGSGCLGVSGWDPPGKGADLTLWAGEQLG